MNTEDMVRATEEISNCRKKLAEMKKKILGEKGSKRVRDLVQEAVVYVGDNSTVFDDNKLKLINSLTSEIVELETEIRQWTEDD